MAYKFILAIFIILLFGVLLVVNDMFIHGYLASSDRKPLERKNSSSPDLIQKETEEIRNEVKSIREQLQFKFSEIREETSQIQRQLADIQTQQKLDFSGSRTNANRVKSEHANRLTENENGLKKRQTDLADKLERLKEGIEKEIKRLEDRETEMSAKIREHENELNYLNKSLPVKVVRSGTEFFYKLTGADWFFSQSLTQNSEIFLEKGVQFFLTLKAIPPNEGVPYLVKYLSIYLNKLPTASKVRVNYEFSILNMEEGKEHKTLQITNSTFEAEQDNWGYKYFVGQEELQNRGFIKNDEILVKAYVEVLLNT